MDCKRARRNIALWVGNDLDDPAVRELQRHCAQCTHCSDHWLKVKPDIEVLQQTGSVLDTACRQSLWPSLAVKLPHTQPSRHRRLSDWAAVVSILAACMLIAVFVNVSSPGPNGYYVGPGFNLDSLPPSYEVYYSDSSWNRDSVPPAGISTDRDASTFLNVDF